MENEKWFGVTGWCNDDIADAIEMQGFEATEENIAKVRNVLNHHSFTDCIIEAGWEFIYCTVNNELEEG